MQSPSFLTVTQRVALAYLAEHALYPDGPFARWLLEHGRPRTARTNMLIRTSAGHTVKLVLRCSTTADAAAALAHYSPERTGQLKTAWNKLSTYVEGQPGGVTLPPLPVGGVMPPPEMLLAILVLDEALRGDHKRLAGLTWGEVDLRGRIADRPGSTTALPLSDEQTTRVAEALARLQAWGIPVSREDLVVPAIPARRLARAPTDLRALVAHARTLRDQQARTRLRSEGPVDTLLDAPGETRARRLRAREAISLRAVVLINAGRQPEVAALPTPEEVADYMAAHGGDLPPSLNDAAQGMLVAGVIGDPDNAVIGAQNSAVIGAPADGISADAARARYERELNRAILDVEPLPDLDWTGILSPEDADEDEGRLEREP